MSKKGKKKGRYREENRERHLKHSIEIENRDQRNEKGEVAAIHDSSFVDKIYAISDQAGTYNQCKTDLVAQEQIA